MMVADGSVAESVLQLFDVSVSYGGVRAIDGVSLTVGRGEILGLIGPNGAGKSTLFDAVSGLTRPSSGRVLLEAVDVTARSARWRARNGMRRTFQRQQVFSYLTVEDNLRVAIEGEGGFRASLRDLARSPLSLSPPPTRVDEVIELCGLESIRHRGAGSLSIGHLRMVELGRALVSEPRLLLLDEPTTGLDEDDKERLAAIVRDSCSRGTSVFIVEHDVNFLMQLSDRMIMLDLGCVVAEGTPSEISNDPRVRRAYLGGTEDSF